MKNLKLNLLITALTLILTSCNSSSSGSGSGSGSSPTTLASGFYTGKYNNKPTSGFIDSSINAGMLTLANAEKTGVVFTYQITGTTLTATGEASVNGNITTTNEKGTVTTTSYKSADIDIKKVNSSTTDLIGTWNFSNDGINATLTITSNLAFTYQITGTTCKVTGQLTKEENGYYRSTNSTSQNLENCYGDAKFNNIKNFYIGNLSTQSLTAFGYLHDNGDFFALHGIFTK